MGQYADASYSFLQGKREMLLRDFAEVPWTNL